MELEPRVPLKKKRFFRSNPYKTDVMITSVLKLLVTKFGHMTHLQYDLSHVTKILLVT